MCGFGLARRALGEVTRCLTLCFSTKSLFAQVCFFLAFFFLVFFGFFFFFRFALHTSSHP